MPTIAIIDGSNLIFRAFFAVAPLSRGDAGDWCGCASRSRDAQVADDETSPGSCGAGERSLGIRARGCLARNGPNPLWTSRARRHPGHGRGRANGGRGG